MKARTKKQREAVRLSKKLPAPSSSQIGWIKTVLEYHGVLYKSKTDNMLCLECGTRWTHSTPLLVTVEGKTVCPHCGRTLVVKNNRVTHFVDSTYLGMITVVEDYQVLRIFYVSKDYVSKDSPDFSVHEVVQHFIKPGTHLFVAKAVSGMSYYMDQWDFSSPLEPRTENDRYYIDPYKVYPRQKFLPIYHMMGIKKDLHDINPYQLLSRILDTPAVETLFKAGQYEILGYMLGNGKDINKLWPHLKICIRNNYHISDPKMWTDHVRLLQYEYEDNEHGILNAHHLCPVDLRAAHQRIIDLRNARDERERKRKKDDDVRDMDQKDLLYRKEKAAFIGLSFSSDNGIQVQVLPTVQAFLEEGKHMHHCVYSMKYYLRQDSLLLSATKDGKRLETVEVNLKSMDINQCYGACNEFTDYHEDIRRLVIDHMDDIRKRAKKAAKRVKAEVYENIEDGVGQGAEGILRPA